MDQTNRRMFLGALAAGGSLAAGGARAVEDGHASGADVAPDSTFLRTIPRKAGTAPAFTASLDGGPIKATSGGWAREITTHQLPIATGIAGAHIFLNAGGVREMHWHASAEWGYIIAGHCQATVIDEAGEMEVVNFGPGDTWYFPGGHAHAIQTLGTEPCHAILAFDDGLFGEHGTFGLTDWMSRIDPTLLRGALNVPEATLAALPGGETYIIQGPVVPRDSVAARAERLLPPARSHRFALADAAACAEGAGSAMRVAPAGAFPVSSGMTGFLVRLAPGAVHAPHWHTRANEWHYVVRGRTRVTLFAQDKHMGVAELGPGDCAYLPRACGHSVENIGAETAEIVGAHDSGLFDETLLATWLARVPRPMLAANLGVREQAVAGFPSVAQTFSRPVKDRT
ncbi:cupin domain-containing protein [Methylobacterium sp. 37f]|uniref:cupin domain-containing protein n=1 Tax=Methylobacterium sp. 37f TaxID=2817058 RepID=UPI001FFD3E65|nr:cupin domain-containing protein [Methylobacterium sp. 37f]MCK2057112.1 cupin domain-containing protein [Methylobacterium sp. 37f]